MSFDDNTYWYGPSISVAWDNKVQIKAGSVLIFRGDISHAGAECVGLVVGGAKLADGCAIEATAIGEVGCELFSADTVCEY